MSTLERAIVIAAEAHADMIDKAGAPYILHPLRMMMDLTSAEERIVAVLHDVCEDCPGWTFER
jgi:(p)ppGpp synthase/HD superfamily hydrolase